MSGIAGHNRGKKWVPGTGYVAPDKKVEPPAPVVCDRCGARATIAVAPAERGGKSPRLCDACFEADDQ